MRVLRYESYGGIDVLGLTDSSVPKIAENEVLIRVLAASLNPFDWKLRNGMLRNFFELDFPVTPGRDGCGSIVELGKNVQGLGLEQDQLVSFISSSLRHGSMAEYVSVSRKDYVVSVAANLTSQECAALPLVGLSAWNALVETAKIRTGMRVLIHGGSGGVGGAAIQIAQHFGADTYATCGFDNVERVGALGAHAIPYDRVDFTTAVSDCDIVFDTIGGRVHEDSCKVLKKGGCLVYLLAKPFKDLSGEYDVADLQVDVLGHIENLRKVIDLAAKDVIRPVIGHSLSLAEFAKAFRLGESGSAGGKIVLTIPS